MIWWRMTAFNLRGGNRWIKQAAIGPAMRAIAI
jgi:hypothetical protein